MKDQFRMALATKSEDICQLCHTDLDEPRGNSVSKDILVSRELLT